MMNGQLNWLYVGAKSYSYRTNKGKIIIKQKGITMDKTNSDILSFDAMKEMV